MDLSLDAQSKCTILVDQPLLSCLDPVWRRGRWQSRPRTPLLYAEFFCIQALVTQKRYKGINRIE